MTPLKKVNLACGSVYFSGNDWINLDYTPYDSNVKKANLLGRLPLENAQAALVYSSHFIEHIPHEHVPSFIAECWRVLAPGGILRLVLPDLTNLCRTYLTHRESGEHSKANFVVLELIDQCVRNESGGQLGRFYSELKQRETGSSIDDLIAFVHARTGEDLLARPVDTSLSSANRKLCDKFQRARSRLERLWIRTVLRLLPNAFVAQNVSLAGVGERHHWLWDFEQLRDVLHAAGFETVERAAPSISRFNGFPFHPLDLDNDGLPRKGAESMYVEARKPS